MLGWEKTCEYQHFSVGLQEILESDLSTLVSSVQWFCVATPGLAWNPFHLCICVTCALHPVVPRICGSSPSRGSGRSEPKGRSGGCFASHPTSWRFLCLQLRACWWRNCFVHCIACNPNMSKPLSWQNRLLSVLFRASLVALQGKVSHESLWRSWCQRKWWPRRRHTWMTKANERVLNMNSQGSSMLKKKTLWETSPCLSAVWS